jgi:hypothetical protein
MGCIYTTLRRTHAHTVTIRQMDFPPEDSPTCTAPATAAAAPAPRTPPRRRNAVVDIYNTSGMLSLQRKHTDITTNGRWQNPMLTEKSAVCDNAFLAKITAQFGL